MYDSCHSSKGYIVIGCGFDFLFHVSDGKSKPGIGLVDCTADCVFSDEGISF